MITMIPERITKKLEDELKTAPRKKKGYVIMNPSTITYMIRKNYVGSTILLYNNKFLVQEITEIYQNDTIKQILLVPTTER